MAIQKLEEYVSKASPKVNQLLRDNMDALEYTFDSLFEEGIVPQPLYRFVDNNHVHIQNGIFTDKGYLSCTSDFDSFLNHTSGNEVACLQFDIPSPFWRIDVQALLPHSNNESEIILPRGLRFSLERMQTYSTDEEIQELLDNVGSVSSAKEVFDLYGINAIHYYKLSLV